MTGKEVIKVMKKEGWILTRIYGSHHVFKKAGYMPVSVPIHSKKDLPIGTLKNIGKCTGINFERR